MLIDIVEKYLMLLFCGRRNDDLKASVTGFIYSFLANSLQYAQTHKTINFKMQELVLSYVLTKIICCILHFPKFHPLFGNINDVMSLCILAQL